MIPKIIHYVWFSDPPNYPADVIECMRSWKEKLPDYEIKLWNSTNFDLSLCTYAKEAYEEGKFQFASDYVRLWVLYNYGGIYLDSDIEVLKSFDDLLDNKAFTCFEETDRIAAWIFGSENGNPIFKEFMDDYEGRHFITGVGLYDLTPNPEPITKRLKEHGLKLDGSYQKLDYMTIYPMDYFCPFNPYRSSGDCFTENTYANHHFNGSWKKEQTESEKIYSQKEKRYVKIFGHKFGSMMNRNISRIQYIGFAKWLKDYFLKYTVGRVYNRIKR